MMDTKNNNSSEPVDIYKKIQKGLFGKPKNVKDPSIFHKLSLVALLAWIGLGADGLSSSSYGPEEAYKILGKHGYLALFLAVATTLTVFIISYAYSRIIEHFPHGGGGYIVASHTISEKAGVISGCALIVDYMLTITVSIVSCVNSIFSFLPKPWQTYKLPCCFFLIFVLIILNIRGVKESIAVLAPIFTIFIITHLFLILYGIFSQIHKIAPLAKTIQNDFSRDLSAIGFVGIMAIFLKAYSLGGGTYTGIEAVSNGMQIMREPKVQTGKRTMMLMAVSLAFTASGLYVCYLLTGISPSSHQTLNAILATNLFSSWPLGYQLALLTLLAEGALLFVGAQAGFIDGPRVMANMAVDSWLPHRFASLSERLTMKNGVLLMGGAAILLLAYTKGSISQLIVMYSINVFLTFSLSEFGMSIFFIRNRKREKKWKKHLPIHATGFILCMTILIVTSIEKFPEGGWITLVITALFFLLSYAIRIHYRRVSRAVKQLDDLLKDIHSSRTPTEAPLNKHDMTAIQLVTDYSGFGVHTFFSIIQNFPGQYKNFIFASVAVVDSGSFKGSEEIKHLENSIQANLGKYEALARKLGFPATFRMATGIDVVETATELCRNIKNEFPRSTVFTGKLVFRNEKLFHRLLHNETAFAIQRKLHWDQITSVTLPIRLEL